MPSVSALLRTQQRLKQRRPENEEPCRNCVKMCNYHWWHQPSGEVSMQLEGTETDAALSRKRLTFSFLVRMLADVKFSLYIFHILCRFVLKDHLMFLY